MNPPHPPNNSQTVFHMFHQFIKVAVDDEQLHIINNKQRIALKRIASYFNTGNTYAQLVTPTECKNDAIALLLPYYIEASHVLVFSPSAKLSQHFTQDLRGPLHVVNMNNSDMFLLTIKMDLTCRNLLLLPTYGTQNTSSEVPPFLSCEQPIVTVTSTLPTLVIVNDAHRYQIETWQRIMWQYANTKIIFLTATANYCIEVPLI